jgi:hypothetical protein
MNAAAYNAADQGELERAGSEFAEVKRRAEEVGDRDMMAFAAVNLGMVAWRSEDFESSLELQAAAVELFRENRDDVGVATSLMGCGWAAIALADAARAEGLFREALPIAGRVGWIRGVADAACGLGVASIVLGAAHRGVKLLGAGGALLDEDGRDLQDELQEQIRDRAVAEVEDALGADAFAAAWACGEAMTLEEIVAFGTA